MIAFSKEVFYHKRMSKNPVVHFEMPYKNNGRAKKFYEEAFGWQMAVMGEDMGGYIVATTTPSDPQTGRPTTPGSINGGFFAHDPQKPAQVPSVVISVDDIKAAMENVKNAGGEVLGEPVDIPGVGIYVSFTDTEGNRVSLLQASPSM